MQLDIRQHFLVSADTDLEAKALTERDALHSQLF